MDQPPAPARRDAAENRARIISAAQRVFAQAGTEASIDDVARAAGVGLATLYRHFPAKDHLIRAALDAFYRHLLEVSDEAVAAPPAAGLEQFLVTVGHEIAAQRGLSHHLWGDLAPAGLVAALTDRTRLLLHRAQQAKAVADTVTVEDVASATRAMRGIIEVDATAWRRHLDYVLAGFRQGITPPPGDRPQAGLDTDATPASSRAHEARLTGNAAAPNRQLQAQSPTARMI